MGERTLFEPGDRVPNDGVYMETGEDDFHMGINDPREVELKVGDRFPETQNDDRKWKRKKRN